MRKPWHKARFSSLEILSLTPIPATSLRMTEKGENHGGATARLLPRTTCVSLNPVRLVTWPSNWAPKA